MTLPDSAWQRLGDYLRETQLLGSIQNTLYWDQNTCMPFGGAAWRGEQLSLLAKSLHQRQSCRVYEELILEAKIELETSSIATDFENDNKKQKYMNIELLEKEFCRQRSIDKDLIGHLAQAKSEGYNLWQEAKAKNDFAYFAPSLKKLIALKQEEAKQIDPGSSCWETLAQPFEPDLSKRRIKELFEPIRREIPKLIEKSLGFRKSTSLKWDIDECSQEILCNRLLDEWGREKNITTIARSPHPFSITLGPEDFRITTRVVPGNPLSCFLATAHEWGHSLYEQGLPIKSHQWFGWPLGQATSMAVHESQSLFWENRVARSYAFSQRFWPHFKKVGAPINSGNELWFYMNPMSPGLNRVEADELTYGLHILIRTDLEIDLLEGGLPVEELPREWNKKYSESLGIVPPNDSEGCLQDVHWSEGMFGYFPSYLLGHLISAQFSDKMMKDISFEGVKGDDPIETCVVDGNESLLISWLRKEIHLIGRQMNAEQLVELVTGKPLSSEYFLNYLKNKLDQLSSKS